MRSICAAYTKRVLVCVRGVLCVADLCYSCLHCLSPRNIYISFHMYYSLSEIVFNSTKHIPYTNTHIPNVRLFVVEDIATSNRPPLIREGCYFGTAMEQSQAGIISGGMRQRICAIDLPRCVCVSLSVYGACADGKVSATRATAAAWPTLNLRPSAQVCCIRLRPKSMEGFIVLCVCVWVREACSRPVSNAKVWGVLEIYAAGICHRRRAHLSGQRSDQKLQASRIAFMLRNLTHVLRTQAK